jgi:hypothetical protein
VNDGTNRCQHGFQTRPVERPDEPGWFDVLSPGDCSLCPTGIIASYGKAPAPLEPVSATEELEAQGVEAQGEELTAAPERVEVGRSGKTAAELGETLLAWVAGFEVVAQDIGRKAAANAGRLAEAFIRVAELERFSAKAAAVEKIAARLVNLERLPELADNLADAVAALESSEEKAAGKAETLEALEAQGRVVDVIANRLGTLRAKVPELEKIIRSWSTRTRAIEEVELEHRKRLEELERRGPPKEAGLLRRVGDLERNLERQARLKGESIGDLRDEVRDHEERIASNGRAIMDQGDALDVSRKQLRDLADVVGVLVRSIWETATDALRSRGMSGGVHAMVMRLVAAPWPKLEPDIPSSSPKARGLTAVTREEFDAMSQAGSVGLAAAAAVIRRTPCEDLRRPKPTEAELKKIIADAYEATPADHVTIFTSGSPLLQKMADLKREEKAREASGEGGPRAWYLPRPDVRRRRVIIESPYAGDVKANTAYARKAMADSLARGEAPLLSHLLYTQVLDDLKPEEREAGMEAGLAWTPVADACVVYCDMGMTRGMERGARRARAAGVPVERRWITPMRDEFPATFDELEKPEELKPIPAPPAPPTGSTDAGFQFAKLTAWCKALDLEQLGVVARGEANASEWVRLAAVDELATRTADVPIAGFESACGFDILKEQDATEEAGVCPPDCKTLCSCPHPHTNCMC